MEVYVIRGLPGSPALRVARSILYRPTDYVVDLTSYWETEQGHLFATEKIPKQAEEDINLALRSSEVSRLAICGSLNKGWIQGVLDDSNVESDQTHWLVVEGASKPKEASDKLYDRLEKSFEIDLYG